MRKRSCWRSWTLCSEGWEAWGGGKEEDEEEEEEEKLALALGGEGWDVIGWRSGWRSLGWRSGLPYLCTV